MPYKEDMESILEVCRKPGAMDERLVYGMDYLQLSHDKNENRVKHLCVSDSCKECSLRNAKKYCSIFINTSEEIKTLKKLLKNQKPKHKVSKLEYDILESIVKTISSGLYFFECDSLLKLLLKKGCFEGATLGTDVKEYFKNCEVDCELGGNENVKRRKV